jgi:drug/metabolite transporter (DMT)-like permease
MLYWRMAFEGEFAALGTATLWAFGSILFTLASRLAGSYQVNKIRIPIAAIFLTAMLFITSGRLWPASVSNQSYYYLIASGIIGLTLGDLCLFRAFVIIGTRLTLLIYAVAPIIAALTAWMMLDEHLNSLAIFGILITISGIWWVTAERQPVNNTQPASSGSKSVGVILALLAGAGQAIGLVLAKAGMGDSVPPLPATLIRMTAAAVAIWLFGVFKGDTAVTFGKFKNRKLMLFATGGAFCGPFLGVWLSLVAVKHTQAGIAMAIMSTVPVLVIPLVIIVFKEKVSFRAFFGALITAAGVAMLFLA